MGKRKKNAQEITPFPPWLIKKDRDGKFFEKYYMRLGATVMWDDIFLDLSKPAMILFFYMVLECQGKKDFEFPYSKFRKIVSKQGFQNAIQDLIQHGFIEIKESGARLRKPTVYTFSFAWQDKILP